MFKKADDVKSNLILTALSYVDFYKPTYAFFENVPGFVNFHLQADRANLHGAIGEIEKGGLKLFIRALTDMKYGAPCQFPS
jgi:DNA (cytosine-5)-methyltransferase 1